MKTPPKLSLDDARLLPRYRPPDELVSRAQLIASQGRALAAVATPGVAPAPAGGDRRDLRGVPVIGAGAGATGGSSPDAWAESQAPRIPPDERIERNPVIGDRRPVVIFA